VTAPAAATADAAPAPAVTDWAGAAAQVRSVASWIVKCFAAIATALVGTSPLLVHLGDLGFDTRGVVAVAGAAVALFAIGVVIKAASDVSLTQTTDLFDLQTAADRPRSVEHGLLTRLAGCGGMYFAGNATFADLLTARQRAVLGYAGQSASLARQKDAAARARVQQFVDLSRALIATQDAALDTLQKWASYLKIREAFDRARPRMLLAAGLAAVGTAAWLGALGIDPSSSSAGSAAAPAGTVAASNGTVGTLTWRPTAEDEAAVSTLRDQLGLAPASCDRATVLVVDGSGDPNDPWQATLLPDQSCSPTRPIGAFAVDRRLATFSGLPSLQPRQVHVTVTAGGSSLAAPYWLLIALGAVVVGVLLAGAFWRPRLP
jgi:hypothetical protein